MCTFCEMAVPLVSRLAEKLGLPGNSPDAVDSARDKHNTRSKMEAAGLPTPRNMLIKQPSDLQAAADKVKFPAGELAANHVYGTQRGGCQIRHVLCALLMSLCLACQSAVDQGNLLVLRLIAECLCNPELLTVWVLLCCSIFCPSAQPIRPDRPAQPYAELPTLTLQLCGCLHHASLTMQQLKTAHVGVQ